MTSQTVYEALGRVEINGEFYEMVRLPDSPGALSIQEEFGDEPPWTSGAPAMVSQPQYTWHLGGFKSRQGIEGTSEFGVNTDTRWAFKLMPSGKINTLSLPSSTDVPISFFEALGYVWVVTTTRIYRIHPTTNAVTLSNNSAATAGTFIYTMGMKWEADYGLVCLYGAAQKILKVSAIGSPDTWTQSADVEAYILTAGINRLFKITNTGQMKNIITGLDPMVNANWGDQVQVGDTSTLPTALVSYERTVFAGKHEGLFGVGDNGFGVSAIKRMVRNVSNCYGATNQDPWILVPHVRGLYRYAPGQVESIGLEKELLNESPLAGLWTAFCVDGDWIYGAMAVGAETYILVGREKRGGEAGFSSITWDTLLEFSGSCNAMWLSSLSTHTRLYFGMGVNVGYVELKDGAVPGWVEYAAAGNRYTNRIKFDDWNPKDFPRVDMVGENLSATKYWQCEYSIDGGAYSNLDINGNAMRITSAGRHSFFLPVAANGREVQYRLSFVSDSVSVPPILRYFEAYAVPQSKKIPVQSVHLILEDGIQHGHGRDGRTSLEQLNDLLTLSESSLPVVIKSPWLDGNGYVKKVRVIREVQRGNRMPAKVVEVALQTREEA
jgi:hypothetical protein